MEISFVKHWKKRKTVEVGHRGMGVSYTKLDYNIQLISIIFFLRFATARENTIYSLNKAAQQGADFVEFDVQLTKDKIPVVYHDFHVLISVAKNAKRDPNESEAKYPEKVEEVNVVDDFHEMAIKDLSLRQLRLLHV